MDLGDTYGNAARIVYVLKESYENHTAGQYSVGCFAAQECLQGVKYRDKRACLGRVKCVPGNDESVPV